MSCGIIREKEIQTRHKTELATKFGFGVRDGTREKDVGG